MALNRIHSLRKDASSVPGLIAFAVLMLACNCAWSEGLFDESARAQMLKHGDGRVAHVETEYNNLYINKRGPLLALTTRFRNESYFDSIVDLKDPDDMPVPYTRIMPAALLYPETTKRILMIGLGAGSISTYLGRAMPDIQIDVVELDPGVIAAGKRYFGLRETEKVRFIESDGRVYLDRHKDLYDLILLDAYRELGVPFHLLTREFYALVKERLASGGAAAFNIYAGTKLYLSTLGHLARRLSDCRYLSRLVGPGRSAGDRGGGAGSQVRRRHFDAARRCLAGSASLPISAACSRWQTRRRPEFRGGRFADG
jgi:predicted O-methyltransferase YrrM